MFQRRVFASVPLPRNMWRSLHISNALQARRVLPSLVVLPTGGMTNFALPLNTYVLASGLADGEASTTTSGSIGEMQLADVIAMCTTLLRSPMLNITCLRDVINCLTQQMRGLLSLMLLQRTM